MFAGVDEVVVAAGYALYFGGGGKSVYLFFELGVFLGCLIKLRLHFGDGAALFLPGVVGGDAVEDDDRR